MVDSEHDPPGYTGNLDDPGHASCGHANDALGNDHRAEDPLPPPLTREQREELNRRNEQALLTPIMGTTLEAMALESTRLATLPERTRLEQL
jgi:hypothetical protein